MTVVYKASVPIYEAECDECHSVIRYQKAETQPNQGYINCPVCGVPIRARTINPITVLDDEEQKKHNATNADRIRAITDEEMAAVLSALEGCPLPHGIQDCPKGHSPTTNCYPRTCWLEWLREEAEVCS